MPDDILEIYEKEDDIKKIKERLARFSFDELKKTTHFYYSIEEKNTDINLLKENFTNFEKIKLIIRRKHRNGRSSYDFYYELEEGTYLVYGISFEEIPVLLNGFKFDRNFKHFKRQLMKTYKKYLIG